MMKGRAVLVSLTLLVVVPRATRGQCDPFCTCIGELADCSARAALEFRFTDIPVVPPTTTELILTSNSIANLSSGAFSHLPALKTLQLDQNQLSSLSAEFFDSLPLLETLILDGNPLQEITTDGAFVHLSSLRNLSIRSTPLTELNGTVFQGLTSVTKLSLDDNQLSTLSTDFLGHLPSLTLLSLSSNVLQSLPQGFIEGAAVSTVQLDLQDNPWSCDCRLQWLADAVVTNPDLVPSNDALCMWPPSLIGSPLNTIAPEMFQCYAPSITQQPQNASVLTDAPYTLEIAIDGAPFPDVVWNRDGEAVNYTERVFVTGYDASLMFALVANGDDGVYSVSLSNANGSYDSVSVTLSVTEATCVDGVYTEAHETDTDCGGQYCLPCSSGTRCLVDGDCDGELVCLYSHQLPSQLLYISPNDQMAFTCANSSLPQTLLQSLFLATSDLPLVITGNSSLEEIRDSFHLFITETLSVPRESLSGVTVSSVGRLISPLLQFEAKVVQNCEETVGNLRRQVNEGLLKATVKTTEGQGNVCYNIRLNV